MRILVVDDEPAIARLFSQRFRREIRDGLLEFVYAGSGEEAVELFDASKADIVMILSDINMPGMSGLELLENIRKTDDKTPIYMISAYENDQYSRLSQEKGANGFIPKPLDFTELRDLFNLDDKSR